MEVFILKRGKHKRLCSLVLSIILVTCVSVTALASSGKSFLETNSEEVMGFGSGFKVKSGFQVSELKEKYEGDGSVLSVVAECINSRSSPQHPRACDVSHTTMIRSNNSYTYAYYPGDMSESTIYTAVTSTAKSYFKSGKKYSQMLKNSKGTKNPSLSCLGSGDVKRKAPLSLLRFLQVYTAYGPISGNYWIGGWPVQYTSQNGKLVGKRTIKKVYKAFTGVAYDTTKARKEWKVGVNVEKNSICWKLFNDKITLGEACSSLKKELDKVGIATISMSDFMATSSHITIEEYIARQLNNEYATLAYLASLKNEERQQTNDLVVKSFDYFKLTANKQIKVKVSGTAKNEYWYAGALWVAEQESGSKYRPSLESRVAVANALIYYLEENGIHFHTPAQVNGTYVDQTGMSNKNNIAENTEGELSSAANTETKTIFKESEFWSKKPSGSSYGGYGSNIPVGYFAPTKIDYEKKNKIAVNTNTKVGKQFLEWVTGKLKGSNNVCTGIGNNKIFMDDLAISFINECLSKNSWKPYYCVTGLEGSLLRKQLDTANDNKAAQEEAEKKSQTIAKNTGGLNTLNKYYDAYAVRYFLRNATSNGTFPTKEVNTYYKALENLLSTSKMANNKYTLTQVYSANFYLDKMADVDVTVRKTFRSAGSSVTSLLEYCANNGMANIKNFYYKYKMSSDNKSHIKTDAALDEKGDFLYDENNSCDAQHYSDWSMAQASIRAMGVKALGKDAEGKSYSAKWSLYKSKYEDWKSKLRTGLTKSSKKGVQHQDGFLPYPNGKDNSELGEDTTEYFKDKKNNLEGKNQIKDSDSSEKKQTKILKWQEDVDELQEEMKEASWYSFLNGGLYLIGIFMFLYLFTLTTAFAVDLVSNNLFTAVKWCSFKLLRFPETKSEQKSFIIRTLMGMIISTFMYTGYIVRWFLWIILIARDIMGL